MSVALSAGLLVHRPNQGRRELLLIHMGGPFWQRRDEGAWSIPKGEPLPGETPLQAARREFREETGLEPPPGEPRDLGLFDQSRVKRIHVFALEGDLDLAGFHSNSFELEWPRGSGRVQTFPEADRAEWVATAAAARRLVKGQRQLLDQLPPPA